MPFIFKGNKEKNPHLWTLSYFLQNPSSSNTKGKMEDIDEQLKTNIRNVLNSIPEETIEGIIHAVKYAGLESLSDLKFVQEEDLILVLKPIQRRKLIKAWNEKTTSNAETRNNCSESKQPNTTLHQPKSGIPAVKLLSNVPLKKCKWDKESRNMLLEVYAKYKTELSFPDREEYEIWRKITHEIRQKCSLNCDELQCMDKIESMRCSYEKLKKKNFIGKKKTGFTYLAQNAFENIENSDILNSEVNESKKVGKYVPPHLRNGRKKSESVIVPKIEDKPFTIKVSNLSKDVNESDIQQLFTPYGTVARIYTIKDAFGQSKGFAFIKFHKAEDATRAMETVNGIEYNKLILKVEWAEHHAELRKTGNHDLPLESIKVTNQIPSLPPFHSVKPSKFNMNNFKKVYSNEDKSVSIKYFWDNFDAENYSIWFCEYLYPNELTLTFMSCNLIEGMFQRSYSMNKNAFASVCLFGEDNSSTISGIWVWKGHDLAFTLSPEWQVDYESYSWKKLDPSSEDTKKLVNEYFTWSGEFSGKKFNQGKIFK